MANEAQIEGWDGPGGQHWAAEAERYDRMSRGFLERILAALAPEPGERILDVGCGNGALALAIAPMVAPEGSVTGFDISSPMLATARRRAERAEIANVSFEQGDAQVDHVPGAPFDAFVSRFGVMFFDDPQAAFANLARALRPGGRVVFACWRDLLLNDWIMVPAAAALEHVPMPDLGEAGGPGPFSLADREHLRALLEGAGLVDIRLDDIVVPVTMGSDVDDALSFMEQGEMAHILFEDAALDAVASAWQAIRATLAARATGDGVMLAGAAWLVTARRS